MKPDEFPSLLVSITILLISISGCKKSELEPVDPIDDSTVTDYDGNVYQTVQIGDQIWMAENLKTTHYSDGTPIILAESEDDWWANDLNKYCWYNFDPAYGNIYGALYDQKAAVNGYNYSITNPSGIQGVCPSGWHLPSITEWSELVSYLGSDIAGAKLKETTFTHWISPNEGATNETGFTALPAGSYDGYDFQGLGRRVSFYTSTQFDPDLEPNVISLSYNSAGVNYYWSPPSMGLSVRCVKDN
jgi:uncharacterized protein (TIGR02145 family)